MSAEHAKIFTVPGPRGPTQILAHLELGEDELLLVKFRAWSWVLSRPVEIESILAADFELQPHEKKVWNQTVTSCFQTLSLAEVADMLSSTQLLEQLHAAEIAVGEEVVQASGTNTTDGEAE